MTGEAPYTVPKEPGRWRAILLAALVHIALLAFFWIGLHWKSETPATIEAEVWDPQPREAAPLPQPVNEPPPQPEVKPPPPPVIEKPVEQPIEKQPDIALEQEKKRKEQERKKREEEEQRLAKLKEQKEREQKLADQKLTEQKRLEQEKLDKQKAEKAAQEKEKKLAEDKKRKQDEAYNQMLAKMRDENMKRITGVTGTGGTGDAPKSQGGRSDGSYAQRVAAKIKSNINFTTPEGLEGNPAAEFEVHLLPDGSIASVRKTKSSGVPGFDDAVARAIDKSQPFPKDKNGSVPSSFIGVHKPKDQ